MQVREFAERVLFARTLEEKLLAPPDGIVDTQPGPAIAAPAMPGRPRGLEFKARGEARDTFPGTRHLEQAHERGRLLHFFANHELLATELMALVLLRFPDAPAAFRRGVLATLRDEQEHTRWYLERMRACGIGFGEIPVSGYFWRCVSGMENPMDYVAGLCLTFEQANLDFARHYAAGFAAVGDADTAGLLDRIYHDEIGHVAYGLKWFRQWKHAGESDWEAFCRTLRFPLTPQRAKGFSVNFAGRRAAGLDPEFIAQLEVFSASRGRTPTVWLFNPLADARIGAGPGFSPNAVQRALESDLAILPLFLGRQDDIVVVPRRPSVGHLAALKRAGFALPEFVESAGGPVRIHEPGTSGPRRLGRLRPWAWSPDSLERLGPLFAQVAGEPRAPEDCFNAKVARLHSKAWGAELLRAVLEEHGPADWLGPVGETGVVARSTGEALAAIEACRTRGHARVVVKEAHGMAGHHALRLWEPEVGPAQRRWIEKAVGGGREVVVEPWLERVVDFSIQWEMGEARLARCGCTTLVTDARGQFRANLVAPDHARRLPAAVLRALCGGRDEAGLHRALGALYERIRVRLEAALAEAGHRGAVGIDAFVYRDAAGRTRLRPIVEVNPRHTMGRVALELMRHVAPGSTGVFEIVPRSRLRREGVSSFAEYAARLTAAAPLVLEGEPAPRLREGALCLNDPEQAQAWLAVWRVSRTPPAEVPVVC